MVPGFNEIVRHQDRVYHIQTEDLGTTKAAVVSQVFCDGQILHSERVDYSDKLEHPELQRYVMKLLIVQHRNMHRRIKGTEPPAADKARDARVEEADSGAALTQETPTEPPISAAAPKTGPEVARAAPPASDAAPAARHRGVARPAGIPPLTGMPAVEGFLADLVSDRRLDLVVVMELSRMESEGLLRVDELL